MAAYGLFAISTLGMKSQSQALNVIGENIANLTTGGFKKTETQFSTLLGNSIGGQKDTAGVKPKNQTLISVQGNLVTSTSGQDVAINGKGFITLNTKLDGSGDTLYTRDGAFGIKIGAKTSVTADDGSTISVDTGYLVDKNGYYVQGWSPETDGSFTNTGSLSSLRVDQYAYTNQSVATTTGTLLLNLPANSTLITDHSAAITSADSGTVVDGLEVYNIDMIDSTGKQQSARLNFTKNTVNTWEMSYTTSQTAVAQVDTATFGGTIEAGDSYTVTIDGNPVTYTLTGAEADLDAVRDAMVTAINADASVSSTITAAAGSATGSITLTADTAGTAFTATSSATDGGASVAQVDTVTIAGTIGEAGDTYSVTVDGNTVTYNVTGAEGSLAAIRSAFRAAINADGVVGPLVTAADSGTTDITLTAATAGTAFSATTTATNGGVTADNTSTLASTTANYTALNDNTATASTTTANVTTTTTSTPITLTFDANGGLSSPSSASSLTFTYDSGGTTSMSLDLTGLTQYAGGFLPTSYSSNGNAAADMTSFTFDSDGNILATFEDTTNRKIYKLPLAVFSNPNALEIKNGNTFAETTESGSVTQKAAGSNGAGSFLPNTHELSNVDLAGQFTKMIVTQQAYNASATTFRTLDEMTQAARDLKR